MPKKDTWIKKRHLIVRNLAYAVMYPYSKLKYGITIHRFREERKRPYLILYNHQTAFDQFFVGMAFRGTVYYLASEDLFSNGPLSSIIRYLVAPIPINKQATDLLAIKNCLRVAREGGTIAIAPEGNRTYSGKTEYMAPSIGALAKRMGLPIVLYRIEGGYGVHPRWSDVVRRGKMKSYVHSIIEPEEYASLSAEELYQRIREGLTVNEASVSGEFRHKRAAEYIERVLYVCPDCGLSSFESRGDRFSCKKCERTVRYLPTKELEGVGFSLPFRFFNDWYEYQKEFVSSLDPSLFTEEPLYTEHAALSRVILRRRKERLSEDATISLFGDRIELRSAETGHLSLPFDELHAVSVLGRNKLNLYHGTELLQIKGDKRFNAVKYVNLYYLYRNRKADSDHGKFLGL